MQPSSGPDEIDGLLRRFFQAEMPSPWPACPTAEEPAGVVVPERPASWLELSQRFASRLALALSVAILLGGSWLLSGSFQGAESPAPKPSAPAVAQPDVEVMGATANKNRSQHQPPVVPPNNKTDIIDPELP